jgi:catechol 2,3-dioxygenase-like lactoylglutathione lyase family enzyme
MPYELKKLTANLVVSNVERTLAFYRDVLGFTVGATVPDASPYVFATVQSGGVEIFLNAHESAAAEYPAFKDRPIGGSLTLFIEVTAIEQAYEGLRSKVKVVMPLEKKWYGVTEFAFEDPDGYVITFAEPQGPSSGGRLGDDGSQRRRDAEQSSTKQFSAPSRLSDPWISLPDHVPVGAGPCARPDSPYIPITSTSSFTEPADFWSAAFSSGVSLISMICSIPRAPSFTGTPTKRSRIPY